MTVVAETLDREVRRRANHRCEYCRVPVNAYEVPFQIDHVIALKHRGTGELTNLALACYHCNLHKGPNIASLDPVSGALTPLFHPRRDEWSAHFEWDRATLVGRSPVGRVTVHVLAMNDPDAVAVREALMAEGIDFETAS